MVDRCCASGDVLNARVSLVKKVSRCFASGGVLIACFVGPDALSLLNQHMLSDSFPKRRGEEEIPAFRPRDLCYSYGQQGMRKLNGAD